MGCCKRRMDLAKGCMSEALVVTSYTPDSECLGCNTAARAVATALSW